MRVRYLLSTLISSLLSVNVMAAIVDRDSDGLIEINNLDDLNEMRNDLKGTSLRGDSAGCPADGCFGYELTRDLDFDTNKNGQLDSGDWNGGAAWVPVRSFHAVFQGNSHTIGSLTNSFFENIINADIKNLGLLKVNINSDKDDIGALTGFAQSSSINDCYVSGGEIESRAALSTGGLVGEMRNSSINASYFLGNINSTRAAGGLVGLAQDKSVITKSYTRGEVAGSGTAGLVSTLIDSGISNSYSTMDVISDTDAGGLVRFFQVTSLEDLESEFTTIRDSYALGTVTSTVSGGLVGSTFAEKNHTIHIKNSYVRNLSNLLKGAVGAIEVENSYWIIDPQGIELENSGVTANTGTGQLLGDMQCAGNPINSNCAQPYLFRNWDKKVWDFGTDSQLPALKLKSNFPWYSTDTPGGTGDFESIARMKEHKLEYACDTPTDFFAKKKESAYVFNAKTPETFRFFSAFDGLACVNADQSDGQCNNYEVSYLLRLSAAPPFWTPWQNNDSPNGDTGDYEDDPFVNAAGIRIRVVGSDASRNGAPQVFSIFNTTSGLRCLNNDNQNGCNDYEVRMTCDRLGDRE